VAGELSVIKQRRLEDWRDHFWLLLIFELPGRQFHWRFIILGQKMAIRESEPKISVVIPIYNAEKYLAECLDSMLNQTFRNWECICVNDGSNDGSMSILEQYAAVDDRIRVLSQKNCGQSIARNRGIDASFGEWIGFLDADDFIDADYYEKMAAAAESDVDIVMAGTRWNGEKPVSAPRGVYGDLADNISVLPNGAVWDKIFRHDVIVKNKIRFPGELLAWEDNVFLIESIFYTGKMAVIDDTFYNYIQHSESVCNAHSDGRRRGMNAVFVMQEIIDFARNNNFDGAAISELQKFLMRTLPWMDLSNTQILERLDEMEKRHDKEYELLGFISLLKIREKADRTIWRLFNIIPLMLARYKTSKTVYRLFGFLPVLIVKNGVM
jgi:glycosyltransferase involved in cell wall biosynthesis